MSEIDDLTELDNDGEDDAMILIALGICDD